MRIQPAQNAIARQWLHRTNANGLDGFSPDCGQKAHLTSVYEAARTIIDALRVYSVSPWLR